MIKKRMLPGLALLALTGCEVDDGEPISDQGTDFRASFNPYELNNIRFMSLGADCPEDSPVDPVNVYDMKPAPRMIRLASLPPACTQ